jgi:hypothetical protein
MICAADSSFHLPVLMTLNCQQSFGEGDGLRGVSGKTIGASLVGKFLGEGRAADDDFEPGRVRQLPLVAEWSWEY